MKYREKKFLSEFVIIIYNIGNFLYRKFLNKKFLMKYWVDALKMFLEKNFMKKDSTREFNKINLR